MLLNFSLAYMNLRAEMRLKPTKNSVSMHSSLRLRDANRKLLLISEIADPPTGMRKHGHTESLIALITRRRECWTIWSKVYWSVAEMPNASAFAFMWT